VSNIKISPASLVYITDWLWYTTSYYHQLIISIYLVATLFCNWIHQLCNWLRPVYSKVWCFWNWIWPIYNWIRRFCSWIHCFGMESIVFAQEFVKLTKLATVEVLQLHHHPNHRDVGFSTGSTTQFTGSSVSQATSTSVMTTGQWNFTTCI